MRLVKFLVIPSMVFVMGCAGTMKAIEYTEPRINTSMTQSIWLDPQNLSKNRNVYVRVMNTSGYNDIDFTDLLKRKISEKGFNVVDDPSKADYIVQVNVLYLNEERESIVEDGMAVGSVGGAIAGSYIGGGIRENIAGAIGGAVIGGLIGGLVGKAVAINKFTGIAEVRIQENIGNTKKEHETRISVIAEKTNMDKPQMLKILADRLATQISSIFVY